jgi:uncharacterized cupredoxin-like copper-binding protein
MRRLLIGLVVLSVLSFLVSACARTSETVADVDRKVTVFMRDDFTYEPKEIEVRAGETIAFEITNHGNVVHEFLIGTEAEQREYAERMEEEDHEGHDSSVPGVVLDPGKSETITYVVPAKKARLYFGCHQPGHYEAGMRGELKYR